ncbi:hypothetical protein SLEP1_g58220 [Rubroshorea leprosula]|uniref:Uncharacterized protein n=1 Tax=Rubroshorea leprosula TaxID=152421 RepID=A0AAV5MS86_9ROSI|nr:hypothetical protein SLEP1_g58220 [Rubroshorea leprosula]
MKSYKLSELSRAEVESPKARPRIDFSSTFGMVNPIIDAARGRGDAAAKEHPDRFGWSNILSYSSVTYGFISLWLGLWALGHVVPTLQPCSHRK